MSIDWTKLKKLLEKNHITPFEYFYLDGECALIKCFLNKNAEFLFIYVSSKLRFTIDDSDSKNKIFNMEDFDETTDMDDYSKSSNVPDMSTIDEKSVNTYKELTKKYQKNISLEGNDEPVSRKIKRQIERLRIPFARLSYDIALQTGKYICTSFGEDLSMFSIKNYQFPKLKMFMYLITIKELIEKVEEIQDEIGVIRPQFYDIINKVSVSNFEDISTEIADYTSFMKRIMIKKTEYMSSISDYQLLYENIIEKENILVREYKDRLNSSDSIKRSSIEAEAQRKYEIVYKSRKETIERGIDLLQRYHRKLFIFEEVSFDNNIMMIRVRKNFDRLKELL
jgi:hypothetical protein